MPPCTICGIRLPSTEETCRWCTNTNLADAEGRGLRQPWWLEARLPLAAYRRHPSAPELRVTRSHLRGLQGLAFLLLGWLCLGSAVAHFVLWTLPRCAWLHTTGRLPLTNARYWRHTHTEDKR